MRDLFWRWFGPKCEVCHKVLEWRFARYCKLHGRNGSVYEVILQAQGIARKYGWAIGAHGSLERDIDLIAVPWTEEASGVFDVYEALKAAIGGDLQGSSIGDLEKPHGRQALMILQKGAKSYKGRNGMDDWIPPAIDISFVDPRLNKEEEDLLKEISEIVQLAETYTFAKDMRSSAEAKLKLFEAVANRRNRVIREAAPKDI